MATLLPNFCKAVLCVCVFLLQTILGVHFPIVYSVQGYFLYLIQYGELLLILYKVLEILPILYTVKATVENPKGSVEKLSRKESVEGANTVLRDSVREPSH